MPTLAAAVDAVAAEMAAMTERGKVADYIPELGCVPLAKFGIAVIAADGSEHVAGDADEAFSIQSVSKVFALTVALERAGPAVWERVGREPSGSAFNSIVQLEAEQGRPRNPFVNAGAIVVADLLGAHGGVAAILEFVRDRAADRRIAIDDDVAASEAVTGYRNVALANYMKSWGTLSGAPDAALATYFRQCAIAMSCRQLARAGRYLAHGGIDPASGARVVGPERARRILSLMLTCGHYDASGDFAFRVGLPAKSGVGGGILAVVPGRATIAVWSPGLGREGNSVLGTLALERLAGAMGWSVFAPDLC